MFSNNVVLILDINKSCCELSSIAWPGGSWFYHYIADSVSNYIFSVKHHWYKGLFVEVSQHNFEANRLRPRWHQPWKPCLTHQNVYMYPSYIYNAITSCSKVWLQCPIVNHEIQTYITCNQYLIFIILKYYEDTKNGDAKKWYVDRLGFTINMAE
jgi:hypothetical protein